MAEFTVGDAGSASDEGGQPMGDLAQAEGGQSELLQGILADIAQEESPKAKALAKKAPPKPEATLEAAPVEDEEESDTDGGEVEEEAPPAKRKFKAKANGKEYEFDEDKIEAELSRGLAARQAQQKEAAELKALRAEMERERAEMKRFRQELETSPEKYLKQHEEIAEKLLLEKAEEHYRLQKMSPEARQEYQARKAAEARLKEFEEKQKVQEAEEGRRLFETQKQQLEAFMTEGLKAHGLPTNTLTLRIMAGIVKSAAAQGEEISSAKAAEYARKQLKQVLSNAYTPDSVESFIADNPKLAEAVRAHYVKKATQPEAELEDVRPKAPNGQFMKRTVKPTKTKAADPFAEIEKFKAEAEKERSRNGW